MTVYSADREIEVDGQKWLLCAVRNNGYVWELARGPGEEAQAYEGLQIDLSEKNSNDEAYDWEDDDLLSLIESVAAAQIREALT